MSAIILKVIVTLLFILVVVSLAFSNRFLFRDGGAPNQKKVFYWLCFRVGITVLLFATMIYGVATGHFKSEAPWDARFRESPEGFNQSP